MSAAAVVKPFSTVLVANRGEIAVRVIRAVQAAGLTAVAVYSDADATAPHVRIADVAVRLGPAPASESYLSIDALLRAAAESGADAVHPGYGFLSERASFAQACADAGLVFVGPAAAVMESMGRKDAAREVARRAGVPVAPSYALGAALAADLPKVSDAEVAIATGASDNSGEPVFPVLVKAAAGGGGKGMRVVRDPADLPAAVAAARREATAAFGDDTLLLERFFEAGRHVEVQVMGDVYGTVLHLYERDCSVQRRHQKVIEEAPAPALPAEMRTRLLQAGVALAREVGYTGAGTVEFLVAEEEFFFLEMNTRLQVEHPVTEAVTGLDLVAMQLQVAAGERLALTQGDVTCTGHAIEARVYAEDPYAGFLPQAGRATLVRWPPRARVDHALESGQQVGTAYDPMLAKVVVHGPDREAARGALVRALDETAVLGLTTNTGFCHDLAASAPFAAGQVHTGWLDSSPAARVLLEPPTPPGDVAAVAAWLLAERLARGSGDSPFGTGDGWRIAGPAAPVLVRLTDPQLGAGRAVGDTTWRVDLAAGTVTSDEEPGVHVVQALAEPPGRGRHRLRVDGHLVDTTALVDPRAVELTRHGHPWRLGVPDPLVAAAGEAGDGTVRAPMPGTVLSVSVRAGDQVSAGQQVAVLEAMKMELALTVERDGLVASIDVGIGDQVPLGQALVVLAPGEEPAVAPTGGSL